MAKIDPGWPFFGFLLQEPLKTDFGPIVASSWAQLGPILGPSWAYLGLPGPSWAHFRLTWALLGHLGVSWPITWVSIGAMLGHLVTNEVALDHVVVALGRFLERGPAECAKR